MRAECAVYIIRDNHQVGVIILHDIDNACHRLRAEGVTGRIAGIGHEERFDNAQKIMLLSKVKVGISACGIGILDGKNVSDYIRTFEINELTSADDVTSVAEKLHKYAFKYFPQVNFFVCGYQNDEPFVYIVNKEIKRSNIENGRMRYASIWSGEQAAITKLLNGNPPMMINHVLMPLKDAIDFADFLVDATIKSQRFEMKPATCGGDIDILVLTKDDSFWFRHKVYKPGR